MTVRPTETAIGKAIREAPETGRKDLADAGCPGLRLRVTPAGAATWALACRDRLGRMRRFPNEGQPRASGGVRFGSTPAVRVGSLATAAWGGMRP